MHQRRDQYGIAQSHRSTDHLEFHVRHLRAVRKEPGDVHAVHQALGLQFYDARGTLESLPWLIR